MFYWQLNTCMKLSELLYIQEGVGTNSIYHWTLLKNFLNIIKTNKLIASPQRGKIYFTRDYRRQFVPAHFLKDSLGFRIDADLLKRTYGRKLHPQGQMSMDWPKDVFGSNWFLTPSQREELMRVKAGAKPSGLLIHGENPQDVLAGRVGAVKRWESEEVLEVAELPNLTKYVTGLVIGLDYSTRIDSTKRVIGDVTAQLGELLTWIFGKGTAGRQVRDQLFEWLIANNIPFVFQGQDVPVRAAKAAMIAFFQAEKAERESPDLKHYLVKIYKPDGETLMRIISTSATSAERAIRNAKNSGWDDPAWVMKAQLFSV